ncbi:MAG: DMT family transporter [Eubacteriales bacterium]|nr:DMT family transporter [Eubacteriales bacterium]
MKPGREYIYALSAILFWGCLSTCSKLITNSMDAINGLMYTCLYASIVLVISNLKSGTLQRVVKTDGRVLVRMGVIGFLGVFAYNYFFLRGTEYLPAQEALVINDLWPALVIIFSCFILKERMTLGKAIAIILSLLGIVVVATNGDVLGFRLRSVTGTLFMVSAAVCYALYSVLTKKETYDKGMAVLVAYVSGTVMSLIILLINGTLIMPSFKEHLGLAFNGILCNAIAYLFWAIALDNGSTAIIANLAYLVPFVSLLVTHFVLGEEITVASVVGLLLIIAGIGLQIAAEKLMGRKSTKNS